MKLKKGQSLLEVVIAVAVSLVLISGLISAITMAIRNSQFSQNQSLATKFAQEGLEKIRGYRDQNSWALFTGNCGSLSSMGIAAPASPFTRSVSCADTTPVDANKKKVTVTVSWSDASGSHKSELVTYLSNWQAAGITGFSTPTPTPTPTGSPTPTPTPTSTPTPTPTPTPAPCAGKTGYVEDTGCNSVCMGCYNNVCVNIPYSAKDNFGANTCNATYYACNGSGSCYAPTTTTCFVNDWPPNTLCYLYAQNQLGNRYIGCNGSYTNATCGTLFDLDCGWRAWCSINHYVFY